MTVPLRVFLAAAALVCAAAPTASAAIPAPPSQWYKLPGLNAASGAQWVRAFAYSTPPNVVYAGLEGGGVFRSTDGGATWSAFNDGFPNPLTTNVRALLASSTGTTVYAGADTGIWKSDGGAWQPLAQGPEDDPAQPKKLNQSVQALISLTGGSTMLAGVFSGGVYKSSDGGATWSPPPANSGMPASETIYSLTENVPGFVYATGGSGVYISTNQGSTWTRMSDGIPGGASPLTTWAFPPASGTPQMLFTSTGSNGMYRSLNGGLTWSPVNNGLGAVRARGFQISVAGAQGAMLYAATENALWAGRQPGGVAPAPPNWHKVTDDGLIEPGASNTIMWALTTPVIPGAGGLGLIAGTQSNGGYFLSFEPVDSNCPAGTHTNTTTVCPKIVDTTPVVGSSLTIQSGFVTQRGDWTGTPIIEYAYQWQKCTTSNSGCTDIPDAEEVSYLVPPGGDAYFYRIKVTATNPAPSFNAVVRFSAITSQATANPGSAPGFNQLCPGSVAVLAPGAPSDPKVGDTLTVNDGACSTSKTDPNNGWFNPAATAASYRWLRCNSSGTDCNEIPGATQRDYTLTAADGNQRYIGVRVVGSASGFSTPFEAFLIYSIDSAPAAIADPFTNPDTGLPVSQAPSLQGDAYVGETLVANVGGWKDPTTDFLRRWMRCGADGTSCTYIQKVASTDPENGPTYQVRADDLGYTLKTEIQADVDFDLTGEPPVGGDGLDNHQPASVYVNTPLSPVVTFRPVPAPPPAGDGGPGPGGPVLGVTAPDTTPPTIQAASLTKTVFVAGKGTTFKIRISEPASVRIVISKATIGRKVKGKCVSKTRKNRRNKKCTFQKTLTTLKRGLQPAGEVAIKFSGKIGKRKLPPGTYRATIIVTDAAGNVATKRLVFKIKRR